jgi:hypothetical protein
MEDPMKRLPLPFLIALLFAGCAAYKELEPEPPLLPAERGYIELKDNKDNFELSRDKKYFIQFPPPMRDHFKLVLVVEPKLAMHAFLTRQFDGKEGPFPAIIDEAAQNDTLMVYAVDPRAPMFFWVIDTVRQDLQLTMRYRYVPEWRYTFEVRYAGYRRTLGANTVDRSAYEAITPTTNPEALNARKDLPPLQEHIRKLHALRDELGSLASVFPEDIAAGSDTAYKQYGELKSRVDDEVDFQENYARVLTIVNIERESRGDMGAFLQGVPSLHESMSHARSFPSGAAERMRTLIAGRLDEVLPYYDRLLSAKSDVAPIRPQVPEMLPDLYQQCGKTPPREVGVLVKFVQRFNTESAGLSTVQGRLRELDQQTSRSLPTAGEAFFTSQLGKASSLKPSVPEPESGRMEHFGSYPCAAQMTRELAAAAGSVTDHEMMYGTAARASASLGSKEWVSAESGLRQLFDGSGLSSPASLTEQRTQITRHLETQLFDGVKQASQQRVDAFAREHETSYANVPALYADSVFLPVHQLGFSSFGSGDLAAKRKQIEDYLDQIKYVRFPENSIKAIYAEFIRNIGDRGVEKARAIVDHGKFYRGQDKQVRGLVEECNPVVAKWIVKPREYRKLFAMPVTTNPRGANEYVFRLGLRIPSEAQFPVFDINIKLPPEVAQKAGSEQWYQDITLNKRPIKNEGRFRITAPVAANNYESQISPVQMDKAGNNVLEVHFKYPGFKVFEVSAMAQVPLIRKN